jgi:hypothetical protein
MSASILLKLWLRDIQKIESKRCVSEKEGDIIRDASNQQNDNSLAVI